MSSPLRRNLPSKRARRLYQRTLNGEERCSLQSLQMSRDWATVLSEVRPRIPTRALLSSTFLVTETEGFFNLLYAHLLSLWPVDSPETKNRVFNLLPIIASSTPESAAKYRMCVFHLALSVLVSYPESAHMSH